MVKNEKELREKSKILSIKDGAAYSVMEGFGNRFIAPYAIALGASNTLIGLIHSVPTFIGTLSGISGSRMIEKTSRKKIVVYSCLVQALLWLPIILIGFLYFKFVLNSFFASIALLIFYTFMIVAGSFNAPAWSSWMKDLVTEKNAEYFSRRNRIVNLVTLVSMLITGFILDYSKETNVFYGFLLIFTIALIGRLVSVYFLSKKYEPVLKIESGYYFTFFQFIKKAPHNNFGRYVIFTTLLMFATGVASPFFAVYMLKDLSLDYYQYTLISIISLIVTVFMLPFWGKFAEKYGNVKVMKITGLSVPFVPLLWFFSYFIFLSNPQMGFFYLLVIETFSGLCWAGLNLSTANFVYDAVTKQRMGICLAYDNITTNFGVLVGAILGGLLSSIDGGIIFGLKSVLFIFLLSFVLRLLVSIIMLPKIREVRAVDNFDMKHAIKEKILFVPKYLSKGISRTENPHISNP